MVGGERLFIARGWGFGAFFILIVRRDAHFLRPFRITLSGRKLQRRGQEAWRLTVWRTKFSVTKSLGSFAPFEKDVAHHSGVNNAMIS